MSNRLKQETSPYLLQHAENPVAWYPWCAEAFRRAEAEDKPVFLSIGYSTCHWCHVMAHESFEDHEIAAYLNQHFISVKVDREERPDIDSIYMAVCQAFTGSGGWPTSVFLTADQRPFFAGTYFPKTTRGGHIGFRELLAVIHEHWIHHRSDLLHQAGTLTALLKQQRSASEDADPDLLRTAADQYTALYDKQYGGFGNAPKFPVPHNLLFLLTYAQRCGAPSCLAMAEHTLKQMIRGGLYDHIGYGFCRYSTDRYFLVPHFEKMLYDNALLILACCKAYECMPQTTLFLETAAHTADYVLREMTAPDGGFFSAQDADSEGEEGKYYVFTPEEIIGVLGEESGAAFCRQYDITPAGNFEGKSIPNLLHSDPADPTFASCLSKLDAYRRTRCTLRTDDKILTAWNSLMITALCTLYRVSGAERYLDAAVKADQFIRSHLYDNGRLYVSFRDGKRGVSGFLDDYASYLSAQLSLYHAVLDTRYLKQAQRLCDTVNSLFRAADGGYYLYGSDSETLISRPIETYDGALPSGNALMAYNLVQLWHLTGNEDYNRTAKQQLSFLSGDAAQYPAGHAMFLLALLDDCEPPMKVTIVPAEDFDPKTVLFLLPSDARITRLDAPTAAYPLKNEKTTFYVCKNKHCLPPANDLTSLLSENAGCCT